MALITEALVTAEEAEDYCQIQSPAHDVVVEMLINSVSQTIVDAIDCDLFSATYTAEEYDGSGRSYMYLPHYPVTTLTTVVEDGITLTASTDFYSDLDNGILYKASGGKWTTSQEGVAVTYVAGYATVPWDVKMAELKEIARQYRMYLLKEHGETSRSTEGSSSSYAEKPEWMDVVSKYRRLRV